MKRAVVLHECSLRTIVPGGYHWRFEAKDAGVGVDMTA